MGATVPEAYGLYFSWGNTDGHPAGAGYEFNQATYNTTPGAEITDNLTLIQDAARANLGNPWRMPSASEFQELFDNCTTRWTTQNGVYGRLFTSNVNGKTLFIPAAGYYHGLTLLNRGSVGNYWSSTYVSVDNARCFYLSDSYVNPQGSSTRRDGFTVRPVQDGTPNRSIIPPTPEDEPKDEETPTKEEPKDKDER